jgi:hypothetical protein
MRDGMNDDRQYICSLTGRACKCSIGKGCGRGIVDKVAGEALSWAGAADIKLSAAIDDLDLALRSLTRNRQYPAPEWRETQRLIHAARSLLKETR